MTFDSFQQAPYDAATKKIVWLPRNQNLTNAPLTIDNTHIGLDWSHQFNDDWSIKHQIVHNKAHVTGSPYYAIAFNQNGSAWTVDRALISFPYIDTQTDATILDLTGHFDTGGMKHTLLLGADYYRFKPSYVQYMSSTVSTTDVFNPAAPSGLLTDPTMYAQADSTAKNLGVYVQDQVKLTKQWQALLGFRYQKVDRVGQSKLGTGFGGNDQFVADLAQHDSAVTPRYGVLWQPQDTLSFYANYAENFGANNGRDWQGKALKPESAKQKEIGAKSQLLDGKLTSTLALFELAKTHVSVCDLVHDPLCQSGIMMTIGEIRSRGTEFDIQGEVQPGWDLTASYTYTDIIISKSTPGSGYVQGNRMANVPRNMVNLWSTYELKGESLRGWKIGGGVTAYSSATDGSNTFNTPGYSVFNAMTSYEFKTSKNYKVTAQLNISNLLNRQYFNQLTAWGNTASFTYGTPRSFVASVKVDF
jgi:iron complex outermembrane receptor protein